jgi:hypothetical protein
MPNTSFSQQALAQDAGFRLRLQNTLAVVAWQVISEDDTVADHASRILLARRVLTDGFGTAAAVSSWIVTRPNVSNFDTSYDFEARAVVNACGDPDLESQIASDWTQIAKTFGG